jgi:hypothetical protein
LINFPAIPVEPTIIENSANEITWCFDKSVKISKKTLGQKVIHDADCLDILRAIPKPRFDLHLDFYKERVVQNQLNDLALEEIAHLITEVRSLIEIQGDSYGRTKAEIKKNYESVDAYRLVIGNISNDNFKILTALGKKLLSIEVLTKKSLIDLRPYEKENGLTEDNMRAAIRQGRVFARGIPDPSFVAKKDETETLAALELRKTFRELGIPTKGKKGNRDQKEGNSLRSVSMIGYGSDVFANAGFLIVDPSLDAISHVAANDVVTGTGKKKDFDRINRFNSKENIKKELSILHNKLKVGGDVVNRINNVSATHTEILYKITVYHAIYYSTDPNLLTKFRGIADDIHHFSPILQAIFLRNQYAVAYDKARANYISIFGEKGIEKFIARFGDKRLLPLFEYSGLHNRVRAISEAELTDNKVILMWTEMCSDYVKKGIKNLLREDNIYISNVEDIKARSLYKYGFGPSNEKCNGPADSNYSVDLRNKINSSIESAKLQVISEYEKELINKITNDQLSILSNESFFNLLYSSTLMQALKEKVIETILIKLQSDDMFKKPIINFFYKEIRDCLLPEKFIYTFKGDLNDIINCNEKDVLFDTDEMRIFVLSRQFCSTECQEIIQAKAGVAANLSISQLIRLILSEGELPDCNSLIVGIANLVGFTKLFNVYTQYKEEINNIINILIPQLRCDLSMIHCKGEGELFIGFVITTHTLSKQLSEMQHLYTLSKQLCLTQHQEKIQNKACILAEQSVNQLKGELEEECIDYSRIIDEINSLIMFSKTFDIYTRVEQETDIIIDDLILNSSYNKFPGFIHYVAFIRCLNDLGLLKLNKHKPILEKVFKNCQEILTKTKLYDRLCTSVFIEFAEILNACPKNGLIICLNNLLDEIEFDYTFLDLVDKLLPLKDDNNLDLLQALVDKMSIDDLDLFIDYKSLNGPKQMAIFEERRAKQGSLPTI